MKATTLVLILSALIVLGVLVRLVRAVRSSRKTRRQSDEEARALRRWQSSDREE